PTSTEASAATSSTRMTASANWAARRRRAVGRGGPAGVLGPNRPRRSRASAGCRPCGELASVASTVSRSRRCQATERAGSRPRSATTTGPSAPPGPLLALLALERLAPDAGAARFADQVVGGAAADETALPLRRRRLRSLGRGERGQRHGQHRTGGSADDALGHAAEQDPAHAGPAVGADDDEVDLVAAGVV